MKLAKLLFLSVFVVSLAGCLDSATNEPEIIIEPAAWSNFYIVNQTDSDLSVTYEIAFADKDSTVAVLADSTVKIFEAGDIGSSPPPSSALGKLSFFKLSNDNTSPILTIHPIVDEDWDVTGEKDAIRFEFVITNDDIN